MGIQSDTGQGSAAVSFLPTPVCKVKKSIILLLYGVALFFILRRYYKTNSGLPTPTVLAAPTYLYGIGLLVSDFGGGVPVVIMAGLTLGLIWRTQAEAPTAKNQTGAPPTPTTPANKAAKANENPPSAGINQGSGNPNTQPYSPTGKFTAA